MEPIRDYSVRKSDAGGASADGVDCAARPHRPRMLLDRMILIGIIRVVPLTPHQFQILLALADAPRHGSAIARAVGDQTDGGMRLWPVMLYSTLDQLATGGFIQEAPGPPGGSERRRYYRLTRAGRRALAAEADRLAAFAAAARARLAGGER